MMQVGKEKNHMNEIMKLSELDEKQVDQAIWV